MNSFSLTKLILQNMCQLLMKGYFNHLWPDAKKNFSES
jgi:hypothetical protein